MRKGLYVACWVDRANKNPYIWISMVARGLCGKSKGSSKLSALPSPDGRHLAFDRRSSANNAWMMEKF